VRRLSIAKPCEAAETEPVCPPPLLPAKGATQYFGFFSNKKLRYDDNNTLIKEEEFDEFA
jgi:hypothetical protein